MITDRFKSGPDMDDESKYELKKVVNTIALANKLESQIDRLHAIGMTRNLIDGKLKTSTSAMCSFKKDLIFEPVWADILETEVLILRAVWVQPEARGKGLYREFLEELKSFALRNDIGLLINCNPFTCTDFDRVFLEFSDFKYSGSKIDRDRHAELLGATGFDEFNLSLIETDFYALLARCVIHYHSLMPRSFGFNAVLFEDGHRLDDEMIEKRMESVRERLRINPNAFDEEGYPATRV